MRDGKDDYILKISANMGEEHSLILMTKNVLIISSECQLSNIETHQLVDYSTLERYSTSIRNRKV